MNVSQRLMERTTTMRVVMPMPGDPPPGHSALDRLCETEETVAMGIASRYDGLRSARHAGQRVSNANADVFVANLHASSSTKYTSKVSRQTVDRLVEKGLLTWDNSAHTIAKVA